MTIIDIYIVVSNTWIGVALIAMSILLLASLFSVPLFMFVYQKKWRHEYQNSFAIPTITVVANTAPSLGLLGTIYGLVQSLNTAQPEEIPKFIGIALTTTYVGALLFIIGFIAYQILADENYSQ
jgi:hypothetical protein